MKKHNIISFIFIIISINLFCQNDLFYYYYKGEKQYLELDLTKINITTSKDYRFENFNNSLIKEVKTPNKQTSPSTRFGEVRLTSKVSQSNYEQIVKAFKDKENIIAVHSNFITPSKKEIGMSSYFYVKLKNPSDFAKLCEIAKQKNVLIIEQNKFMPLWYTLQCTKATLENTMVVANYFFETGLFASSSPDFLSDDIICTNDPDFSLLWGLNNSTNLNIDINSCSAWGVSQGDNITVAVLDQGVELTHVDLNSNISNLSYDSESNSSPSQLFGEHGTHCAGIVGAIKDNMIQVVGVAPNSTLMSVSNSLLATPNSRIKRADGINWAWMNGADVISNSWGSAVQYDVIDDAIENALVNGMGGKGTVIVFASGNAYGAVSYPANSNPDIITVGAIDRTGIRASFSNYGTELDIVAPGVDILSTVPTNATAYMSGTSMACPHIAGVAALILSKDPNLTVQEVSDIIGTTANKIGGYNYQTSSDRPNGTWNNEMGYGLVDAYAALLATCATFNFNNQTVTTNTSINGCKIVVENVLVSNGANLNIDAEKETLININFEVQLGSSLSIY